VLMVDQRRWGRPRVLKRKTRAGPSTAFDALTRAKLRSG
jgi:hypothetical protein